MLTASDHKALVRRLIDEVMNGGRLDVIDELYMPTIACRAREWIEPFLVSFSEVYMEVVDLVAEDDRVAARFRCSGTHTGDWLGHPSTGRRFERVDESTSFASATAGSPPHGASKTPPSD